MLITQRLRAIQNRFGYLPDDQLRALAAELGVPLARIEELTTFFPAFRPERDKPAALEVRVCRDMTCHLRGAAGLLAAGESLAAELNAAGGSVRVEGVSCLGRCDRAPVAWVEGEHLPAGEHARVFAGLDRAGFPALVRGLAAGQSRPPDPDRGYPPHTNAAVVANAPLWEIDVYGRNGWPREYRGVAGFVRFLTDLRRRAVPRPPKGEKDVDGYVRKTHPWLWRLKEAGLGGMGGALASAYQKWYDVWEQRPLDDDSPTDVPLAGQSPTLFTKYVVANGDESEPGTFKDRELMLRLPHLVVEGVILCGLMVGATEGFIFVRHEYHEQIAALRAEVKRAEGLRACGANLFGSGRDFPVTVVESPGGYILGEQSALLEALEDRRGQPRNRPPEITANGLRDRPTVLNNVETLGWIPHVMLSLKEQPPRPPESTPTLVPTYPDLGWQPPKLDGVAATPPRFGGKRLFSVSGDVKRPGVYEVPIGLPLGELLDGKDYCGGVTGELKAVAPSGPSGGFLPARLPIPADVRQSLTAQRARLTAAPPDRLSFGDWFVLAHLTADSTHVDIRHLPLDKAAFTWLGGSEGKDDGVLPQAPLLGAGIAVYAAGTDILTEAVSLTRFFRNESCGKCVPCRIGSEKLVQLGEGLLARREAADLGGVTRDVADLTVALTQTSICSLGASAPNPLATALTYFRDDVPRPPTPRGAP